MRIWHFSRCASCTWKSKECSLGRWKFEIYILWLFLRFRTIEAKRIKVKATALKSWMLQKLFCRFFFVKPKKTPSIAIFRPKNKLPCLFSSKMIIGVQLVKSNVIYESGIKNWFWRPVEHIWTIFEARWHFEFLIFSHVAAPLE